MTLWERALKHLEDDGQDTEAVIERGARNVTYWKDRKALFPTEELIESERDF